ncbi:MAG: hypothetical protein SW833_03420 [Cyanobacteriota bacterium]|nr:hypothetical protein [Cyanobacteriota bacterium]
MSQLLSFTTANGKSAIAVALLEMQFLKFGNPISENDGRFRGLALHFPKIVEMWKYCSGE